MSFDKCQKRTFIICLFLSIVFLAISFEPLFAQFTEIDLGVTAIDSCSVNWLDFNNDGNLDFLTSGHRYSKLYSNNGNGTFTDINLLLPGVNRGLVACGDYNNDGNIDVALGSTIYRNNGNSTFTDIGAGFVSLIEGTICWGDYDNDGDLDLLQSGITALGEHITRVYKNQGYDSFQGYDICRPGVAGGSIAWGDYDNDGDLDVLQTGWLSVTKLYRNDGNEVFTDTNAVIWGADRSSCTWGDYDNDGHLDFLITGITNNIPTQISIIYRNNGNGTFTDIYANLTGLFNGMSAWGDYDNDGDLDVLITGEYIYNSQHKVSIIYRNNGDSTFTDINADIYGISNSSIAWGDYDNDSDLDIIITGKGNSASSELKIYRNDFNMVNQVPLPPVLSYEFSGGVCFQATASGDDTTPSTALHYNYRLGMTSGGSEIISPAAGYNGKRKLVSYGNSFSGKYIIDYPPSTDIDVYAAAQTIDNSFAGSNFSTETHITATTPTLNIVYPNGGETIVSGLTSYIQWDSNSVVNLRIAISADNGQTWNDISLKPVPSKPGIYYYIVPNISGQQCKARIAWFTDNSYFDISSAVFTILPPPVQITYPNGNEVLASSTTSTITWVSHPYGTYQIQLSTNNGQSWTNLAQDVPCSEGSFSYTVPTTSSNLCKVRIYWSLDLQIYDVSDSNFSIELPWINLLYPNGGETLVSGTSSQILWDDNTNGRFYFKFTSDNGISWVDLNTSPSQLNGIYYFTVPSLNSENCRISIVSETDASLYDISSQVFSVTSDSLLPHITVFCITDTIHIVTPGQNVVISCVSSNIDLINIDYSINNGLNWIPIVENHPVSSMPYLWSVPNTITDQAKIRIRKSDNPSCFDVTDSTFVISKITLLYPNGGERLVGDYAGIRAASIRWTPVSGAAVNLYYSTKSAPYWIYIATVDASIGHYSWVIPAIEKELCKVRISRTDADFINDTSDSHFSLSIPVKFVNVDGGGFVNSNTDYTIRWRMLNAAPASQVHLEYKTNNSTWIRVNSDAVPVTDLSMTCNINYGTSSEVWFRLVLTGKEGTLAQSADPTVITTKVLHIITPVQGSILSVGSCAMITWSAEGCKDLNMDYTTDFGNTWIPIASNIPSTQGFPVWLVPNTPSEQCRIRLQDTTFPYMKVESDYEFIIRADSLIASFYGSPASGFTPCTVQFYDIQPSGNIQFAWDFNHDGIIDSNAHNPIWTYLFPGTYTVSLYISNGVDDDLQIRTDYINVSLDPSKTRYVPSNYPNIQSAIDAAIDGDFIIVEDGTYYENLVIEGKNLTLGSYFFVDGDTTHISHTIIDGGQAIDPDQASTLTILPGTGGLNTSPFIVGFTIRNGSGRRIIQNIGDNTVEKRVGGGIYINQSDPMFSYNKIEDNDADDEGGGSFAFYGNPNWGGLDDASTGIYNPGCNYFANNNADIGNDIYVYGISSRDEIKVQNCSFEVFNQADTTLSNYWATSEAPLSFTGSSGIRQTITSDIYVSTDGNDATNTGLSSGSPFKTIDYALSRAYGTAAHQITIHIASGTYSPTLTGERFPLQMVKYVSLLGAGQDETFLDAEANAANPNRVINFDRVVGISIRNLTVMGGYGTLTKNYNGGGIGIINSELSITNTLINGNSAAGDGAGIYTFNSTVVIDSVTSEYNAALGSGGGLYASNSYLTLTNSTLNQNTVNKNGAGVFADNGQITIENCTIQNNQATGSQSKGGGISLTSAIDAKIKANLIKNNNADNGAGIYLQSNTDLTLDRNRILNNLADYNGGGLFINTTTGNLTNNLLANNTASQRGGGLYCYSSPNLINNTIANNKANTQGGGLYLNTGSPAHTNTIYWGNVTGTGNTPNQVYIYTDAAEPAFSYCNVQGGSSAFAKAIGVTYSGTYENNLDSDPLFRNPTTGAGNTCNAITQDFTLQEISPCIDNGAPGTVTTLFPFDLAGNPRIDNTHIDMGAYELVHYFGPIAEVNLPLIDFQSVNVNGHTGTVNLIITNTGNQNLVVSEIHFQSPTEILIFTCSQIGQEITPGNTLTIELIFDPNDTGEVSNVLQITSNSLNQQIMNIAISGMGVDASMSLPNNVSVQLVGDDVHLSWNPVLADELGNPYSPDGYIILASSTLESNLNDYLYLDFVIDNSYTHNRVARYNDKMFYRIIAVKDITRTSLGLLSQQRSEAKPITWGVLRKALFLK